MGLLVTLDALLQEGSVTGAARRMGLSTPAMSHALARIRERLKDQVLVRLGRGMALTPRAEGLKARVHAIVTEAQHALDEGGPFNPATLKRDFLVYASDYVLTVVGMGVDRTLQRQAPHVGLRFVPNSMDDIELLREGVGDLAIGIYGVLPQEMRNRQLLTDRFVTVFREGHPTIGKRLTLEQFVAIEHVQVAPRGRPGGYLDDVLHQRGLSRHVARAVPFFLPALYLTSQTDYLCTISERVATIMAPALGLRVVEPPLPLDPYALSLVWHPRFDGDHAHRLLREAFVGAAKASAGNVHPNARTRLDVTDPTSGQTRKRPRAR
jgi:DNA-binding transcriptional LysR family regulator